MRVPDHSIGDWPPTDEVEKHAQPATGQDGLPVYGEQQSAGSTVHEVEKPSLPARTAKRTIDLLVCLIALVVLTVPVVIIMLLVVTTSRGPVLFTQTRVGRDGRLFTVLKFRTMLDGTHRVVADDERLRAAYRDNDFKLASDDPRITPIGKFLRKTSLDELPQLVNVFWGDMSIVGIRPLLPDELTVRSAYDREVYGLLRPGLTGLWQVTGRSSTSQADRIALDRRYVEQWTLLRDLAILLRTPFALLRTRNAQ